jgi:hypothetical protein
LTAQEKGGLWFGGAVLALALGLVLMVVVMAANCVDPAGSTKDALNLKQCSGWVQRWYLILRDWQTGIGAAIGLLGVAWSTFYKAAKE